MDINTIYIYTGNDDMTKRSFLTEIEWYLLPIAEGEQEKAAVDVNIIARDYAFNKYTDNGSGTDECALIFRRNESEIDFIQGYIAARKEYAQSRPEKDKKIIERFKRPEDKEIVEIALLFNDGKIQKSKLRDMVAMADFIIDRLYENGDVMKKSSNE